MVFSIVVILLVGLITYFHYVQGFFSATISAIISIMAALLAVSYNETVVNTLLKGKMADVAHSFVLCAIFAVSYMVLRVIFDMAIQGNVRTPSTVDKIGAALMGVVCGIFAIGIFTIAVEMLPFGATISLLGYSRYPTNDTRSVVVLTGGNGQNLDSKIHDEMVDSTMTGDADSRAKEKTLLFPVDDWVLDTVYHLSDGGSLAGDRTLASVHPDYLQELFGERLGQQDGARRSALVFQGNEGVSLGGVFTAESFPVTGAVMKELRGSDFQLPKDKKISSVPGRQLLIVRVIVHGNSTDDEDRIFRFSPGSIHLVAHPTDAGQHDIDYYPIGTLQGAQVLLLSKPDDFLFLNVKGGDGSFDAVFQVGNGVIVGSGKPGGENRVAPNTFISVKRFGVMDLSDQPVVDPITASPNPDPMRETVLMDELKQLSAAAPAAAAPTPTPVTPTARTPETPTPAVATPTPVPEPAKPTASASGSISTTLSFAIGCKTDNADDPNVTVAGGTMALKGGNIAGAHIDPVGLADLTKGDSQLKELAVPDGYKLVQISYTSAGDASDWTKSASAIQLADANGNAYRANGVVVKLSDDKVMVRYDMNHAQFAVPAMSGTIQSTTFLFVIRNGTHITTLQIGNDNTPTAIDVP